MTGSGDKAVRLWQVTEDGDQLQVTLRWTSTQTVLTAPDLCIHDVRGLSPMNVRLLKQRGAHGEPAPAAHVPALGASEAGVQS